MKFKHIVLSSMALTALTFASCSDDIRMPEKNVPGASISFANVTTGRVSRDGSPDLEYGSPNENAIDNAIVVIYETPLNAPGSGKVLKVLRFADLGGGTPVNPTGSSTVYGTDQATLAKQSDLLWYDGNGNGQPVYVSQGHRAYIANQVTVEGSAALTDAIEDLKMTKGENTDLYALALVNMDMADLPTLAEGMKVSDMRDIVYKGKLYLACPAGADPATDRSWYFNGFPWGPTGFLGGAVRFRHFAMSAVNEVKFKPRFDDNGRFEMPSPLMVQRLAARIDICFGVQAGGVDGTWLSYSGSNNHPYITDRAWYLLDEYNNADDTAEKPSNPAYNKPSWGRGYRGIYGDVPTPEHPEHYEVRYLYDLDITGPDNQTGKTDFPKQDASGQLLDEDDNVIYDKDNNVVTASNYTSLTAGDDAIGKIVHNYEVTDDALFSSNNYEGYYRFPIYDEEIYQANKDKSDREKNVFITGTIYWLQEIRLTNCNNVGDDSANPGGMFLFQQAHVGDTRRYLGNDGAWAATAGGQSYSSNFVYSYENRVIGDRQLTEKSHAQGDHRPVTCIQSGIMFPSPSPTLWAPGKTDSSLKWGVYSILGYVGENTFETEAEGNKYTGIHLSGVSNMGHYFTEASANTNNDNNQRVPVSVDMKLRHSFSTGADGSAGNMHFGIVRNTVYRVYVKFYAKGETLGVRMYYYDQQDNSFEEVVYTKADFYSNVLEDDNYHEIVD